MFAANLTEGMAELDSERAKWLETAEKMKPEFINTFLNDYGLQSVSWPIVVSGPCPGKTLVSSPSGSSLSRIERMIHE